MYKLLLGIEHLMTGVQIMFKEPGDKIFQFQRESPSIVAVLSDYEFMAYWPVKQTRLDSELVDGDMVSFKTSLGEVEHYAKNVAPLLVDREQRSYDMQTYSRRYGDCGIENSRLAPNEPQFTYDVIQAMRRKHGADADKFLAKLRWSRDHWWYEHQGQYVGVETDGYIHT